jgi:hypothetical protein
LTSPSTDHGSPFSPLPEEHSTAELLCLKYFKNVLCDFIGGTFWSENGDLYQLDGIFFTKPKNKAKEKQSVHENTPLELRSFPLVLFPNNTPTQQHLPPLLHLLAAIHQTFVAFQFLSLLHPQFPFA